ncbi:MAG TPA: MarR family transcriptional regulator [Bacteroidales bacterium]|nr:MarR family transcriptional regulator [Bacteroidales bacterium]HPJ55784.1 MarR family transcriptional regulator [Bacteroidales bacterium]HPQ56974.1 MarR family transcriptional regulator [Bacteroidales bacterium]
MEFEQLKLSNQLCFPIYAASRLITREYQPHLDKLGITYPQYLVLMVLWENDGLTVNEIAGKLILNTNTVTPLLKRMETMKIITRTRSGDDERKVLVRLTQKGKDMRVQAAFIPLELLKELENSPVSTEKLLELKGTLYELIGFLQK